MAASKQATYYNYPGSNYPTKSYSMNCNTWKLSETGENKLGALYETMGNRSLLLSTRYYSGSMLGSNVGVWSIGIYNSGIKLNENNLWHVGGNGIEYAGTSITLAPLVAIKK